MNYFVKLLDENLKYIKHKIVDNILKIWVESSKSDVTCPYCGTKSSKVHSHYERSFQDLPMQDKKVIIIINNRKMFCNNQLCNHKTFAETYKFLSPKGKKTKRLEDQIINISMNVSSITASNILSKNIAKVCKSTVCNLLKKGTIIINKDEITKICIDDFAIKKRHTYGSIMIDIDTHKVIDIINSREKDDVKEWLGTYKNLKVISRDGSMSYKTAISLAHPNAIQVSDRFHLIKNLTDYCVEYLRTKFNSNVMVSKTKENIIEKSEGISKETKYRYLTLECKWKKVNELIEDGLSKPLACKKVSLNIKTYNKLMNLSKSDIDEYFFSTLEKRQAIKREQKSLIINKSRELYKEKYSLTKISEILGIDRKTVKKYVNPLYTPQYTRKQKVSVLDPYKIEINDMLDKGMKMTVICKIILEKGCLGSSSNLRRYCSNIKKKFNNNDEQKSEKRDIIIKRSMLLKALYRPFKSILELDKQILEQINEKYPFYMKIIELVNDFKFIMKNRDVKRFEDWIIKAKMLHNPYIDSFISGIKRDIEAVKNSIKYNYNNGLAEGV